VSVTELSSLFLIGDGGLVVSRLDSERDTNFYVRHQWKTDANETEEHQYILKFINSKEPTSETELQTEVLQHLNITLPAAVFSPHKQNASSAHRLVVPQPVASSTG